ncbi:glutathione S-transferase family protein [Rhodovastum atsumiense]|uniref:Glutathione S-transferase family protein n=1 Tax=Rhodovastum atsumiense TaxID=504468 RepID=A0A5M6ILW3_9PROT|nr:glutathione S-transferase family protein [Rhodovastum atsumiense]
MRLIGMLDSPYVRRVGISLAMMEIPFTHEPLSVFADYAAFGEINPVVKAPTFVTDDGTVLMDSTLILDHLERLVPPLRRLTPEDPKAHARCQRLVGLALAACEKTVQIVYEHKLRPAEKRHQPWIDRIEAQLAAAYAQLEAETAADAPWLIGERPGQADISVAVAWTFTRSMTAELLSPEQHPRLAALAARAEALPAFIACPRS